MYPPTPSSYSFKLIAITAVVTMVITSVVWVGIGASAYWFMTTQPPNFQIQVDHPRTVQLGEVIEIKISVENVGTRDVSLANIDIYDELADGFEILDVTPKPLSSQKIIGYYSYDLYKNLTPGSTHDLTVKMRAKEVGLWSGDIDACNTMQNWVTHYTEIEIVDPAVAAPTVVEPETEEETND